MLVKTEHPCSMEIKCTNTTVRLPRSMEFPRYAEATGKGPGRTSVRADDATGMFRQARWRHRHAEGPGSSNSGLAATAGGGPAALPSRWSHVRPFCPVVSDQLVGKVALGIASLGV